MDVESMFERPRKWDAKRGRWRQGWSKMGLIVLVFSSIFMMAAVTQIDLVSQVKGILPSANGGTGTGFFAVSGPTALRTYTFPDSNATVEVQANKNAANGYLGADANGKLTVSQISATGTPSATTVLYGNGTWAVIPGAASFDDQLTPTGTVNGTNTSFTTAHTCTAASLMLFKNGQLMKQGASDDYTYSGSTITYASGAKPLTGDVHVYSCRY